MILCDREIREALEQRRLFINPSPVADHYSSNSVDLTLSNWIRLWEIPPQQQAIGGEPWFRPGREGFVYKEVEQQLTRLHDIGANGYLLSRGAFILGYTVERIYLPHSSRLCARVEGKSSLARLGLGVHVTAPTIHAGYGYNKENPENSGTDICLEIWNVGPLPIELLLGMRICQVILEEVREAPTTGYQGQFNPQG